jgi:hypothetical protein
MEPVTFTDAEATLSTDTETAIITIRLSTGPPVDWVKVFGQHFPGSAAHAAEVDAPAEIIVITAPWGGTRVALDAAEEARKAANEACGDELESDRRRVQMQQQLQEWLSQR